MSSGVRLELRNRRFLPGCAFGLAEPTALVELAVTGVDTFDAATEQRLKARAGAFYPEENYYLFFGVDEQDWPAPFLVDGAAGPCTPAQRLGQWVVALTVILQRWAYDVAFRGAVVDADPSRLLLAIPWRQQSVFSGALELAVRLIPLWSEPEPDAADLAEVTDYFHTGLEALHTSGLVLDGLRFAQAAVARDIPIAITLGFLRLGWGADAELLHGTFTGHTAWIAHCTAKDKIATSSLLGAVGVPVPAMRVVADYEGAESAAAELGWPVVIKPPALDMSAGIVPGIDSTDKLRSAFAAAAALSPGRVMVEKHVPGDSHRLLVVHGRLLDAVRRIPPEVTGDGVHSIAELIVIANADPRRAVVVKPVKLDDEGVEFLREQGLDETSVPEKGRLVRFAHLTYRRVGGYAEDVSTVIHPDNRALAERVARVAQLDIAGVDLLIEDISRSWREVGGCVCEVNSQPALMPHWLARPDWDVNGEILDLLIAGRPMRIPTAAVVGVGETGATALLLQEIWEATGRRTGVCTTEVLRIGDDVVSTDNLAGQPGTHMILADPGVEAAVFEVPTDNLIELGHGCDRYDVVAILGTDADVVDLHTDVLHRAHRAIVVNADDPLCMDLRLRIPGPRHVLVTRDAGSVALHCAVGGDAVFIETVDGQNWLTLAEGENRTRLMCPVGSGPAPLPVLFAAAVAWAQGVDADVIGTVLASGDPTAPADPER